MEKHEDAGMLLAYCSRELDAGSAAALDRHLETCAACREFVRGQRMLWKGLDLWEAPRVSPDFDRRLYQSIDKEVPRWDRWLRPLRPMILRPGLPVAAAACVAVLAGVLLQRPAVIPAAAPPAAEVETVQPDQVEHALDTIDVLSEFSRHVRTDAPDARM